MLTSGVEGLVDVTGKVGEVCIEQESGDFTAIGFSVSVAARTRGICIAFVRVTVTPETPSNDIRVLPNINAKSPQIFLSASKLGQ